MRQCRRHPSLGAEAARNLGDIRRYKTLLLLAKTSLQAAGGEVDEATLQAVEESCRDSSRLWSRSHRPALGAKSAKRKRLVAGSGIGAGGNAVRPRSESKYRGRPAGDHGTGYFTGLIPAGDYTLGTESFTVLPVRKCPAYFGGNKPCALGESNYRTYDSHQGYEACAHPRAIADCHYFLPHFTHREPLPLQKKLR